MYVPSGFSNVLEFAVRRSTRLGSPVTSGAGVAGATEAVGVGDGDVGDALGTGDFALGANVDVGLGDAASSDGVGVGVGAAVGVEVGGSAADTDAGTIEPVPRTNSVRTTAAIDRETRGERTQAAGGTFGTRARAREVPPPPRAPWGNLRINPGTFLTTWQTTRSLAAVFLLNVVARVAPCAVVVDVS